jgi:hypothetical protein
MTPMVRRMGRKNGCTQYSLTPSLFSSENETSTGAFLSEVLYERGDVL